MNFSAALIVLFAAVVSAQLEEPIYWSCPCENGYCSKYGDNECTCAPGYTGVHCDILDECQTNCDHGYCDHEDTCHCLTDYSGEWCDIPKTMPCDHCVNGFCTQTNGNCYCNRGWTGEDCDVSITLLEEATTQQLMYMLGVETERMAMMENECPQCNPKGSTCGEEGSCDCKKGWEGTDCSTPTTCATGCQFGWCDGSDTCHCNYKYEGKFCDVPHYFWPLAEEVAVAEEEVQAPALLVTYSK